MSEMSKLLGEALQEAGAAVYYVPTDHAECRHIIGKWAYNAKDLHTEIARLRACIERCKSVQRVADHAAAVCERVVSDLAVDTLIRDRSLQRGIVYREVADELGKALEGF